MRELVSIANHNSSVKFQYVTSLKRYKRKKLSKLLNLTELTPLRRSCGEIRRTVVKCFKIPECIVILSTE